MPLVRLFLFTCVLLAMSDARPAAAQAPATPPPATAAEGPVYVVTYFEVAPSATAQVTGVLRPFAAATRKEDGNVEFEALHDLTRAGRFAIVEAWRDKAALDAHGAAMKTLGDKLQPEFAAPFDARRFGPLATGAPPHAAPGDAVYVLTHVDVFPAGKDEAAAMLKTLVADSGKEKGAIRFDALIQDGRPNHFHLIEVWSNRAARDAHALTDHTRTFRAKLVPFEGALYDERLYEAVR